VILLGGEVFAIESKSGVVDQTTNGNNATYVGGMGAIVTRRNCGYAFDRVDDNMTVPTAVAELVGGGSGLTANFWILPARDTDITIMNLTFSGGLAKLLVDYTNVADQVRVGGRSEAADSFRSITASLSINRYMMLTCVLNVAGDEILIYHDGSLLASGAAAFSASTVSTAAGTDQFIGRSTAGSRYKGLIDEVRLFNSVLTAGQVSDLYDLTSADLPSASFPPIGPGGLVY
jgi:hypothetical protein